MVGHGCCGIHEFVKEEVFLSVNVDRVAVVFFFKQKTAYEIGVRLVGSAKLWFK